MRVERDVEQQVGLDDLEPLVHERGRVDRDKGSHGPGRMGERLLDGDVLQCGAVPPTEGPAAGRQHQPTDLGRRARAESLGEGRVLGVDRHDLSGSRERLDERPADDQRLLVGQRQGPAGPEGRERGTQPGRAREAVEHHVAVPAGELGAGIGTGEDARKRRRTSRVAAPLRLREQRELEVAGRRGLLDGHGLHAEVKGLAHEQLDIRTAGGQGHDGEPLGVASRHVEGLGADGAGAAQHHDPTGVGHLSPRDRAAGRRPDRSPRG